MTRPALLSAALLCLVAAFAVADSIERSLLLNTARLVLLVELFTLPVAAVLAFLVTRTDLPGKRLAVLLCSSLLFIPLYLQLCGWEAAFGRQGWQTYLFNTLKDPWLSGWRGAVFVHVMYSIPWATCLMAAAFFQGRRQDEETALLEGKPWQVFWNVTLPQLRGGLSLAAIWIFVITAGEMTVTNIYLVPTYAEDVYNFYANNADVKANVVHYVPLFLFVAALVIALFAVPSPALLLKSRAPYQFKLGFGRSIAAISAFAVLALLNVAPVLNLIECLGKEVRPGDPYPVRSWSAEKSWKVLRSTPTKSKREFANTGKLAVGVTTLAMMIAAMAAWAARRRQSVSVGGWILVAIGIALPGPIISLGVIAMLNHNVSPFDYLYDRTLLPAILAVLVRVLPLTFVALWGGFSTLEDEPLSAAALDGAGPLRTLLSMAVPQRWPLVIVAGLAAFVVASGDVSASLLVLPPGPNETIGRNMFGLIHVGADDRVAGVALLCWGGYLLAAGAIIGLLQIRSGSADLR